MNLLEAHANFASVIGRRECVVCNEEVTIANLHVLWPCGHGCMCTVCVLNWENEGGVLHCPFDREVVTSHIGVEAWLAEKAAEAFARINF